MIKDLNTLPADVTRHRVLNTAEAAGFCSISIVHWRRLYRRGDAPKPIRIGTRKYGWKVGDLIDWLATKTQQAIQ